MRLLKVLSTTIAMNARKKKVCRCTLKSHTIPLEQNSTSSQLSVPLLKTAFCSQRTFKTVVKWTNLKFPGNQKQHFTKNYEWNNKINNRRVLVFTSWNIITNWIAFDFWVVIRKNDGNGRWWNKFEATINGIFLNCLNVLWKIEGRSDLCSQCKR